MDGSALTRPFPILLALALLACSDSSPSTTEDDVAQDPPVDSASDSGPEPDSDSDSDPLLDPEPTDLPDTAELPDTPDAEADAPSCPSPTPLDYTCSSSNPATCPDGFCVFGQCIAPVVDGERWADCGDGTCGPCEDAELCAADCAAPPTFTGALGYDPARTITVQVHGFNNVGSDDFESTTFGEARGGGLADLLLRFQPDRVDGRAEPTAPNQVVSVEYYGAIPPAGFSDAEIAEIQAFSWENEEALHRYALIVATFVDHRLEESGADWVDFVCHSMGCHVIRYLIEHDLRGLGSSRRIARWATVAGVVSGARLARLYDNPTVREVGGSLGLNTADFIHMHPDYVADHSARWDHRAHEANSPLFTGLLIHHVAATDPEIGEGGVPLRLLDLDNPGDEPNDGIVHTFDERFEAQADGVRPVSLGGVALAPSTTYLELDHFTVSDSPAAGLTAAAALYHSRRVTLRLRDVQLLDDRESDGPLDFDEHGPPPAELVAAVTVRYDPWVLDTFGESFVVHEQRLEDRSPDLRRLAQDATADLDLVVFEGPVFDAMTSLQLELELLEVDQYPRFDVAEWLLDPHQRLLLFQGPVALVDGELQLTSERVVATLEVRVDRFYEPALESE